MKGNLTSRGEANKCFTPNKQIWLEMNQVVPHAINKQVRDLENKIFTQITQMKGGEKKQEMVSITIYRILFIRSRHQGPLSSFYILSSCKYIMCALVYFP
jgi:hypothetical protein